MNSINKYNDFLFYSILEKIKNDELSLIISDELSVILNNIYHPIANKLMEIEGKDDFKSKVTLLDVDNSDKTKLDNISFTVSSKATQDLIKNYFLDEETYDSSVLLSYLKGYKNKIFKNNQNRSVTSFGRLINKLFPGEFKASGEPGKDIESFVNMYKALLDNSFEFELVKGEDIVIWYGEDKYSDEDKGTLNSSCMRFEDCSGYIEFYAANPSKVSLLILKDLTNQRKIRGRALVWNLTEPENRIFMDRIYYTYESDVNLFINYAKEKEWIYKKVQTSYDKTLIDSKNNIEINDVVVYPFKDSKNLEYPFMDTLKFYDGKTLSSSRKDIDINYARYLEDTEGSFETIGIYSTYYEEMIDEESENVKYCPDIQEYRYVEDCFYSDFYNRMIDLGYALRNGVNCDFSVTDDNYRKINDYITLRNGETATKEYARTNFKFSEYTDEWIENYVYSEKYNSYFDIEDSIEVFTNLEKTKKDWRLFDDDTYFKLDDVYYDNSLKK